MKTYNTNWKHFEQLKWPSLTACVLRICETRNTVSTKQLRKNYHQKHSPTQQSHICNEYCSSAMNTAYVLKQNSWQI